jgi:predicted TIM-barrel fold metal-dependent hydrolase
VAAVLGVAHSPPAFDVPAGACDCHVHIFGPYERYPLVEDRVYMPGLCSVDDLVGLQRALCLDRVVIVQASPQGTNNACLIDSLRQLNGMGRAARGVAVVNPDMPDAGLKHLHDAGVRALRVNLQSYGTQDPTAGARQLLAASKRAAQLGWHVQIYTNLSVLESLEDTILSLPTPLVVDHFALAPASRGTRQPGFQTLLRMVAAGNVYVKLSAPYRITNRPDGMDGEAIARAMIDANLDRMLWGTDWPHTGAWPGVPRKRLEPEPFHPIDDGHQLNLLGRWASADELRRILVDNPARLFGF